MVGMSSLGLELGLGWTLLARYLIFSTYVLYLHGKGGNPKKMGEKGENPTKTGLAKVSQIVMSSSANLDEQLYSSYLLSFHYRYGQFEQLFFAQKYPCNTHFVQY